MPKSAEEAIRQAMQDGQFDDLPGKGKPLKLDDDPFENPEWRLANKILKDGGFTLPWIETRREIELELEAALEALRRSWAWRQAALASSQPYALVDAEWQRAAAVFREKVAALNKRIFSYNLEAPSAQFQLPAINTDREVQVISDQ